MIKTTFYLVIIISLSACNSIQSIIPEGEEGLYFHAIQSNKKTVKTWSVYGLGSDYYNVNSRESIGKFHHNGLRINIFTDNTSSSCLSTDAYELSEVLPSAFPNIDYLFSGHTVNLIFTRKKDFSLEKSGGYEDPIYFVVRLDSCRGLEHNSMSIMRAIEIVYHELFHLESYLKSNNLAFEEEEEKATIFGICAILKSKIVDSIEIPNPEILSPNMGNSRFERNFLIRKSAYARIASHFGNRTIDTSNEDTISNINTLCNGF